MFRRRRGSVSDPRDFGPSGGSGRFSRFRPGRGAPPPMGRGGGFSRFRPRPAVPESSGRGGCCLWPFMLGLSVVAAGSFGAARAAGTRFGRSRS